MENRPGKIRREALRAIGPAAATLAEAESLEAHGLSVTARLARLNDRGAA